MPEVPGQFNEPNPIVHTRQVLDTVERVIRAAIINKHDGELISGALQCLANFLMDGPYISGFVMCW
jgi:hypothetical protein